MPYAALQANFYRAIPDTVAAARKFASQADLAHAEHSPPPHSIRWWLGQVFLMYLDVIQWLFDLTGRIGPLAPSVANAGKIALG